MGRVSHHLGDALYQNACLQGLRAERMPSNMVAQRSTNTTRQAHDFEIGKQPALAHRIGEYLVILFAILLCVKRNRDIAQSSPISIYLPSNLTLMPFPRIVPRIILYLDSSPIRTP